MAAINRKCDGGGGDRYCMHIPNRCVFLCGCTCCVRTDHRRPISISMPLAYSEPSQLPHGALGCCAEFFTRRKMYARDIFLLTTSTRRLCMSHAVCINIYCHVVLWCCSGVGSWGRLWAYGRSPRLGVAGIGRPPRERILL